MATCLGKQSEVGKGHGQVGPGRGGANQFPRGGQLVEKKGTLSHIFTYSKLHTSFRQVGLLVVC